MKDRLNMSCAPADGQILNVGAFRAEFPETPQTQHCACSGPSVDLACFCSHVLLTPPPTHCFHGDERHVTCHENVSVSALAHQELYNFDNEVFGISDEEARFMSPQQRVVLEGGYECLFRGGLTRATMENRSTGVFVGETGTDWDPVTYPQRVGLVSGGASGFEIVGCSNAVTCSRVSHTFGLRGPINTTDTAFSEPGTGGDVSAARESTLTPRIGGASVRPGRIRSALGGLWQPHQQTLHHCTLAHATQLLAVASSTTCLHIFREQPRRSDASAPPRRLVSQMDVFFDHAPLWKIRRRNTLLLRWLQTCDTK